MGESMLLPKSFLKFIVLLLYIYPVKSGTGCDQDLCANCIGATAFQCTTCKTSPATTIILSNVCLPNCPYGFATTPSCTLNTNAVVDVTFDQPLFSGSYGPFITATSSSTYQFFWSPESVDPIPAYQQGLYFSSGDYLSTSGAFYTNYNVALCVWYKTVSTSNDLLYIKSGSGNEVLRVNAQGGLRLNLEQKGGGQASTLNTGNNPNTSNGIWFFLSYTVTYSSSSGDTTMVQYLNTVADQTTTGNDQLLRWYQAGTQTLIIGKGSSGNFNGWVYNFKFWNTNFSVWAGQYSIVCGSGTNSCFVNCVFGKYWSGSSCVTCASQCTNGCIGANKCNCYDPLCAVCTGWASGLCTTCTTNASGGGATACSCDPGYYNSDSFTCTTCPTGCATCTGGSYYQCSSCLSGYYFLTTMCLSSCPAGYTQDSTNNVCTLSTSTALSIAFQNQIVLDILSGVTVGSSNTNKYPTWESTDPIPSIYRGYYFTSTYYMTLSSLSISPYFTVTMWINPSVSGNIVTKFSTVNVFLLSINSSGYPSLALTLNDASTVTLTGSTTQFNAWHNIAFTSTINASGKTVLNLYIDGTSITSATSTNASPFVDAGTLYIGRQSSSNGFTGFLWSLKIYNDNTLYNSEWKTTGCATGCSTCPSEFLCPSTCSFGTFLSGSCVSCAGSCSPYGCRSTDTCRLCKYKECTTCTLFDGPCTACITNASLSGGVCSCNSNAFWVASTATCDICDNLCATCTGTYYFLCSACSGSAVLVGNACLNACPYGFSTSPSCTVISTTVIDQTFDTNFLGTYGIFTTSTSTTTYQFWNSPDSLDPVPAYKRGLYFSGGQYLVSNTNIYLSNTVSMGLWVYVITAGDILQKQTRLSLSSAGVVTATLENPSQATISASTSALSAFSGWTYLSFTITYTSGATTITAYKNGSGGTTLSNTAYLYRDAASDLLYLGKSSTSSTFVGFIYYFSLWNAAITDFSSKFTIPCGTSLVTTCLWSCTIGQYYATSSCTSCNSCGNLGCRRAISCSICDDPLCSHCSGFGGNLCTLCVTHASGGGTTPCSCDTNYIASTDGFSCVWACTTGCAGCSGTGYYQCTSCLTSYYYLNGLCLSSCPTGYTQDSTNHLCTLSSNTPVSLALQDWIKLDTTSSFTVGSSSANAYPSWTDSTDPVPSIYRGYYFTSSSLMSLSSLTITPFYTAAIWVKATSQGNLFLKLNGSSEMFKIVFTSSGWPTITLKLTDSTTVTLSGTVNLFNAWHNIVFTGDIVSGNTKIYFYTDGVLISNQVSGSASPFTDSGSLYLGYSNAANGFTGFLWSLKIFNGNTHYADEWITSGCPAGCSTCPSELLCPDNCAFGSFLSSGSCSTCAGSCSPYGCRSTETCRLCQYRECTTCTLFDGPCTACITNAGLSGGVCSCNSNAFWVASSATCELCDTLCSTCTGTYYFLCSACSGSAVRVGTICLNACPYGFSTSPSCTLISTSVIDQTFDTSFGGSYGIFTTSTSATTYQFWNSPDSLDPIPAYKRGLYFNGGQYLVSNTNIYLSNSVSLGLWVYVITAGDILQKQTRLSLSSAGVVTATLENPSQSTISASTTALSAFSGWTYLSFTITYTSGATTITAYKNAIPGTTLSNTAYLYRDAASDILYLGKSSTSSTFVGFIYYFSLWNAAITDFSSKFTIPCGTSLDISCLWSCTIAQYYATSSCTSCNSCGNLGCRRAISCSICDDPLCSQCSGFGVNLCTLCVTHASGGGTTPCSCDTNYIASTDGFSCIWACTTGCAGCSGTGYYQCTSCLASYYYLNGLCLSSCPTGYTQDSTNHLCTLSSSTPVSLALQDWIKLDTISSFTVGSSSANAYPSWTDSTDPVPSIYRGYYFTSSSLMSLSSLTITPFYTVTIWVKATSQGNLFLKLNGSSEIFKIVFTSSGWPTITLKLADTSGIILTGTANLFNAWHNIAFTGDIASGYTKIFFYTDGSLISSQASANASPFTDSGSLYLGYSNTANGFTGFLWSLKIFNGNTHYADEWKTSGCPAGCSTCPSELLCPDNCAFGSFLSSGSCSTCAGSCSPYGCRSTETCRLCQYRECTTCTLFDGPCTACITNAGLSGGVCSCNSNAFWVASSATCELCDTLCSTCTGTYYFLCSACSGSAVLVGTVCLNACPYGFSTSPSCTVISTSVIDQTFDTSFGGSYGMFTTSTSATTYQFWNSPDSLDPIPAYKRGLYFNGGQYLVSNTNIYLSNTVSMGLWVYVITAGDILQKQTRLSLSSAGVVTATLENPSQSTISASTTALSAFSGWTYLSFTITYTSGATTITAYNNGAAGTTLSNTAYLYRDAASDLLYLGKSSTSSTFVGFIYYFSLWNTAIIDFSSKFTIPCGTSLVTTCLWSCTIGQYYATSSYASCNSCGNLGCRRAISCSICDDYLCSQCSGFGANLCTLCVTHASGGGTTPCSCDTNYIASTDGFSCIWACTTGCAGCSGTGYYQCTSCLTSYYYLNGLCLSSCPTGYTQDSTSHQCTLLLSTSISLALTNLIQLDSVSGFTVGSSSANAYPSWTDSTDPVPSIYRGYYFTSSSLMSLSSLTITPFYTVTIWVKAISQGNLFLKLNGSSEIFKIVFTLSEWPQITLVLQDSSSVILSGSTSLFNSWHNIAYTGDIVSGYTKILFYTDGSLISNQMAANASPFIDAGSLYLGYSNGTPSFTGFLWSLKVYNGNTHFLDEWQTSSCSGSCSGCPSELICPDNCGFGSFYSSGSCTTCDGSCSPHGCRSSLTCRLCKNKECTACTLFDGPCTACITNAGLSGGVCSCNSNAFWIQSSETCEICDNLCSTCLQTYYFECSTCTGTKILVDTVCLNECPYSFTTSPSCVSSTSTVIDQSFDTVFQGSYGILTTSNSASTYQFFTSPESADPVPSYERGLYFSGSQYLQANVNIYLSYQFSVGLWIYTITDGDIFQKQARVTLASNGVANIILESPSQVTTTVTTTSLTFSGWSYLCLTVSYMSGSTSTVTFVNNVAGTPILSTNLLFRDISSDILYVGKSTSSGFNGFIYYFSLWNTVISDFSSKLTVPCGSASTSCLWACDISKYYDGAACQSCNSCALGCTQGVSCNICYDHLCSLCSGFGSGLCTQCVSHASGGGATACSCDVNYIQAADGFSCVWGCTTGCGGCSGTSYYQCTSCLTMYYFISGLCISVCPTGYTQDSVNNQCTLVSNLSFSLQFQDLIQLDTVSGVQVGSSSTNTYPTFESTDPVPSIYRGYYFISSSYMASTSLILNTYFTVTIWVKPISSGYLMLKINGSNDMFKISLSSSGVPTLIIALQDSSTVSVSGATNLFNGWHNIAFTSDIISGKMEIYLYTDGVLSASQISANASPFIDLGNLKIGASSGSNGFTGFLWSLEVFNSNSNYLDEWKTTGCVGGCSTCPSELLCPDNCDFGYFYSSGCTTCDSSCSPYGCRSSLTCRLCLQKECKECTLFDGPCTSCIDRATLTSGVCACDSNAFWVQSSQTCEYCDSLCTQCAGAYYFLCTTCTTGETLAGNICLHECPYGFGGSCTSVSSPVITQSFDQNFAGSYGIFTTASSSSTYQFFNSPEISDPIPAKKRGLYFSSGKYLESSIDVYLSYSFSLGFWAYVETAGDFFEKQNRLIINSSGAATIILESPSLATTTITTGVISSSGWSYYSITISYSSGSTIATVYINNIAGTPSSTSNYIFRDVASQTILIGKSTASSFAGFIYNFKMWNSPITDFSTQVNNDICGTGLGSTCLWACGLGSYQNSGGTYSLCNSCSLGCVRGVSCNVCDDKLCSVCTGFGSNLCTTCVTHASGSVCSCDTGYYLSSDGFSCVVCSTGCSSCTGVNYYQCSSCISSYYYINNLCEPSCPTGYTQNSATHNCDLSSLLGLYLNLIDQLRLDIVSGFTVGSDSTNTYPSWDAYDPIPSIQRGYYFTGSSYMRSNFKFSPYFSLSSWIKGLNDGYFLTKYDGSVYLSISFTAGIPTLTIKLLDGTTISVSGSSSIFNSWSFFSFSGQILGDGTTKIISYVNGAIVNTQISGSSSFFRDSASGTLILGADQTLANGWEGYAWNLQVYSDNSHAITDWVTSGCGTGCTSCPTDLTCLSSCSLSSYPTLCTSCKAGCSHGCVGGLTCRLCKAKECLSCNTFSGACLSCIPNASLSGTTCQCNANALWVDSSESCELCNSACASCSAFTFADCITCSSTHYLFENLCINYCPTGYSKSGNKCIIDSSDAYIFNLKPNQIKDEVIDLQSSIITSTGNDTNFYPTYEESDPYAAQYRGYYFNGKSYMNVSSSSKALILAPKFTISIWLNPTATSCDLFTKQSNSTLATPILKLSLSSLSPSLKIKLSDGSTALYSSTSSLNQNQWNLLIVSSDVSLTPAQVISFSINSVLDASSDLSTSLFEDLQDSFKIMIGSSLLSSSTLGNYFTGFIWDLKIRNKIADFSSLYSTSCSQCSLCPVDNSAACIPNCPISEYWDGTQCSSCNNACSAVGCVRYDKTCNLCNNVICSVCDDFIAGSCLQCKTNAYLSSGECICNNGYYLNKTQEECLQCKSSQYSVNGICKDCPSKCTSCVDSSICETCIANAELSQNNSCVCQVGYNGTACDAAYFYAYLAVNDDNSLNLTFSENLANVISLYDLSINVENVSLSDYSWTMERMSDKFYTISLSFSVVINSKTPVAVKLLNLTYFVSETNALLKDDTLVGVLYHYSPYSSSQAVSAVTSQTTAAVQSIIGASVAVSFINPNPASLWSMLNTLNYIAYLGLTKIPMTDSFYAFVINMNGNYYLPNLFEYFIDKSQGTEPYAQAIKYGYDNDLILLNVGSAITTFGAIVAAFPLVYFLSNCSQRYLARKLAGILKNYKWSVFVRFWIQSYLDFTAAALIGLFNFSFGNVTQVTNTIICLGVFIISSISPLLFFMLSYKNLPKIQEREKGFEKLWSSFFYEFKNDQGLMSTQYYSLFFGRRFIYIMNVVLLNNYPASQVTISTVLSLITVLYLIKYRPYEEPILQITNTLTEICTMLFMGLMSANLFNLTSSMQNDFELTLISVAIGIMGVQTASSIALFGKTCYELVKEGLQKSSPPQNRYSVRINRKDNRRIADLDSSPTEINRSIVNNDLPDIGDEAIN